jgi:3-hydroxybutyryl-CoA dehydrogenase
MIKNVTIVGVGWMGRGIAQVCAQGGYNVTMRDLDEKVLDSALKEISSNLQNNIKLGIIEEADVQAAVSRIKSTTSLDEALKEADLVIEAVPEVMDIKKAVFSQMDKIAGEKTILATNTSTLSITAVAEGTTKPERVVGMHWFYPAFTMPAVEVIKGARTAESTAFAIRDFALGLGKVPVVCKEVPGFLINRLQMVLYNEAASLLEQGVASKEDIDNAARMSLGLKLPFWGPLQMEDRDVPKNMLLKGFEYVYSKTGSDKFKPTELLREKVRKGEVGVVAGKGWYDYPNETPASVASQRNELVTKLLKFLTELGYAKFPQKKDK